MRGRATIRWVLPVLTGLLLLGSPLHAAPLALPSDPYRLCAEAIARQERSGQTPPHLLLAIALAESARRHPVTGAAVPWPWAVMAEGRGRYLATKAEAIAEVQDLQARGIRNIDVGCMQINLGYHPDAFASLAEAFDPGANVGYAADYLRDLFATEGSWPEAAGRYHSATPELKYPYQARVMALWEKQRGRMPGGDQDGPAGDMAVASLGAAPRMPMPPLRQRQPTPAMINQFIRQLRMPTAADASASPRAERSQRALPPLINDGVANSGLRDAAAAARFAERRAQYLQAWREAQDDNTGPVTVLRGHAQEVYSVDMR